MGKSQIPLVVLVLTLAGMAGCTKEEATNNASGGGATSGPSGPVAVAGTLAVGDGDAAGASAGDRAVELVAEDQTVIATGKTDATGAFTIALPSEGAALTGSQSGGAVVATLRTLFLNGAETPDALGVRKQLVIDGRDADEVKDGVAVVGVGTHTAKRVGAIVGKVTLETGEDAAGIDIFVPGTVHGAKTASDGGFILGFLPPGTYQLRADRRGFTAQEWVDIVVGQNTTTHLPDTVMPIATGPSIVSIGLTDGSTTALSPQVSLRVELKAASKYRVSLYEDFRDASFKPYDARSTLAVIPVFLGGKDGVHRIHVEAADADGLSINGSLDVLLDTAPPTVPRFSIKTPGAEAGYAANVSATLHVTDCLDVSAILVRPASTAGSAPAPGDFAFPCKDAAEGEAGMPLTLTSGDGVKELVLWALDAAGQVSPEPRHGLVTLDTTAPPLTLDKECKAYPSAVRLVPVTAADARVHYRADLTDPDRTAPVIAGELALFNDVTLKLVAIDRAGNRSAITSCQLTIDGDGPILGSVALTGGLTVTKNPAIPLTLSAIGATRMHFAESKIGLQSAAAETYSTSKSYTLQDTSDGDHTVYVMFTDDAGNAIGRGGEFSVTVNLDRTAPPAAAITLLNPATPASDFDKLLAWSSGLTDVTYEVEVYSDSGFTTRVRPTGSATMTTTDTSVSVTPAIDDAGTYYWRVRAADPAGNTSDWVQSRSDQAFTLTQLASAFAAKKRHSGRATQSAAGAAATANAPQDWYVGRELVEVGDLNGGKDEIAWSMLGQMTWIDAAGSANQVFTPGVCTGCGAVVVRDIENDSELHRIQEDGGPSTLYGQRMIACDVVAGGAKELVVSAPAYPRLTARTGGDPLAAPVVWPNAGAVFIYSFDGGRVTRIVKHVNAVEGRVDYDNCEAGSCWGATGNELAPSPLDRMPPTMRNTALFGWSLACESRGDGDRLWIGEPGWTDSAMAGAIVKGRVARFRVSGNSLVSDGATLDPGTESTSFATNMLYLADFEFGTCDGPTLAVSAPTKNWLGSVILYGSLTSTPAVCGSVDAPNTGMARDLTFGLGLHDLGDVNSSGRGSKLAVSDPGRSDPANQGGCTSASTVGPVRIYGDGDANPLAAARFTASSTCGGAATTEAEYGRFGSHVARVGDLSGDNVGDIGVGAPLWNPAQRTRGGVILAYRWADLVSMKGESDSAIAPAKILAGIPEPANFFGARFFARPHATNGYNGEPSVLVAARPGWGKPAIVAGMTGGTAGDGPPANRGRVEEYASSRLKIGQAQRLEGSHAGAAFGTSMLAVPDVDGDGVDDLVVGQPNGRCASLDWGMISVFSGKDSRELKRLCGPHYNSKFGSSLFMLPGAGNRIITGYAGPGATPKLSFLGFAKGTPAAAVRRSLLDDLEFVAESTTLSGDELGYVIRVSQTNQDAAVMSPPVVFAEPSMPNDDLIAVGNPAAANGGRKGIIYKFAGGSGATADKTVDTMNVGSLEGTTDSTDFGAAVAHLRYSTPFPMEYSVLAIGAPGVDSVYIAPQNCVSSGGGANFNGCSDKNIIRVKGADPKCLQWSDGMIGPLEVCGTIDLEENFGANILPLPDLDGPDTTEVMGPPYVAGHDSFDIWLAVANTGPRDTGATSRTPQIVIVGLNTYTPMGSGNTLPKLKIARVFTGERGTALGQYMQLMDDLDGDAKIELVVAEPNGVGLHGMTGQLRFYSTAKLNLGAGTDPLVQVIYNPDNQVSNFGASLARADMNGDGTKDILVGADQHSGSAGAGSGAVYVFPIEPVTN